MILLCVHRGLLGWISKVVTCGIEAVTYQQSGTGQVQINGVKAGREC